MDFQMSVHLCAQYFCSVVDLSLFNSIHKTLCMCVHVRMCVCVHIYMFMWGQLCIYVFVKVRGQHHVSASITIHTTGFFFLLSKMNFFLM